MLEVLFGPIKIFSTLSDTPTMSRGRPSKDPGKKRSALIKVYLPKTKKQWIKNCAKGQGMSMSRYIEKVVDGQIESLQTEDFCTFLVRLRNNLKMVQDENELHRGKPRCI